MKKQIPIYDICKLNQDDASASTEILAERLSVYMQKHYTHLHTPHRHSFFHFIVFTKGKGTHTIDFNTYPVKPFQAYFMIPGQVHGWQFDTMPEGYIVNFSDNFFRSLLLNPDYLSRFDFFSGISDDGVIMLPAAIQQPCMALLEKIIHDVNENKRVTDLVRTQLLQFFLLIDQALQRREQKNIPQQKQALLQSFRRLIESNYKLLRLPKEYADLLYVTPNHLNALCQDLTGKTAGELIRDRIILEAKRLLTNAGMTSAEIAYELNFQDNSYFTRFFKKYTGTTPDVFRKSLH